MTKRQYKGRQMATTKPAAEPTLVISRFPKVDNSLSWCQSCKQAVKEDAATCPNCGVKFKYVTTDCPQFWMHQQVQTMRPDLEYKPWEG